MEALWASLLAELMGIDWRGIARKELPAFVNAELKRRVRDHVPQAAAGAKADGWSYASVTDQRPNPPEALIGDLVYRLEKGTIPGGQVRDFVRDHLEPAITAQVAPQIDADTPLIEVAEKVADAGLEIVF